MARYEAEREETRRRKALREAVLRAPFPGFLFSADFSRSGDSVTIGIGVDHGPNTSAQVHGAEVCALVRGCKETGIWAPLLDWLLEREEIGNPRFRAALGLLATRDPEGWRAWPETHRSARAA
jgi:hypothetical protein